MHKYRRILVTLISSISLALPQSQYPKFEFRGAWIATVANLDWPSSPGLPIETQQSQLINLLDKCAAAGINAVIFQIRPECDALYHSSIEPWSYWLTGQQGKAPAPFYDPLQFAINEAHKRGMELHAWFNPYRAVKTVGAYSIAASHVSVRHPEWIITRQSLKILNPGLQEVRDYVLSVIRDVLERYAIDAIHFDDYFYPYEGITTEDAATFAADPRGFTNVADWRRDNVNLFVAQVRALIQEINPRVKFGISPFGIWKSGVPEGIVGMSAYSAIYCDALAWLKAGTIDYLAPQCYWKIGGDQDYSKLVPWWAQQTSQAGRHLYVGQIFNSSYSSSELQNQVAINRATTGVQGNILFRAAFINSNTFGFADYLKNIFHKYKAIPPAMPWRDEVPPNSPRNFAYRKLADALAGLSWDYPDLASDGDSAKFFVLYRFRDQYSPDDLSNPANIVSIIYGNRFVPAVPDSQGPYYYVLTAMDAFSNESRQYAEVIVAPPVPPLVLYPQNNDSLIRDTLYCRWQPQSFDSEYELVHSTNELFSSNQTVTIGHIGDTTQLLTNLEGQKRYYWKIRAANAGSWSAFSEVYLFTTAFPVVPVLLSPIHASTNVSISPTLTWSAAQGARSYRLQVAKSLDFNPASIVLDNATIVDTFAIIGPLEYNRAYYWRLKAQNEFGASNWSTGLRFKTVPQSGMLEVAGLPNALALHANYPNPFNAYTTISFDLPTEQPVSLKIFDLQGALICDLIEGRLAAGRYKVWFDGSYLPSGFYFYQLKAGDFQQTRKMVLVK